MSTTTTEKNNHFQDHLMEHHHEENFFTKYIFTMDHKMIGKQVNWINESFGGFGKTTLELLEESEKFQSQTGIQLDRNYNAKLWFWLKNQR